MIDLNKVHMIGFWGVLGALCFLVACSGNTQSGNDNENGTTSDTSTTSDGDSDSDSDGDGDTDGDSDSDSDGDGDTDGDSDSDSDGDGDSDSDSDTDSSNEIIVDCIDMDEDGWCTPFDCNDQDSSINPDAEEIPNNDVDENCDGVISTGDEATDSNEDVCFEEVTTAQMIPTRVMLLVDASQSMVGSKMEQARDALVDVLTLWETDPRIEFGLDFFPDQEHSCNVSNPVLIDVNSNGATVIMDYLQNEWTIHEHNATPLCFGMRNFNRAQWPDYAPQFTVSNGGYQYLIVVSDGGDNCWEMTDPIPELTCWGATDWGAPVASALLNEGIRTIAIAYAYGQYDNADILEAIAQSGGSAFTDAIAVPDGQSLANALETITQEVFSCTIDLSEVDEEDVNMDEVNVYFVLQNGDKEIIGYDPGCLVGTGWDWEDSSESIISLCDGACSLLSGDTYEGISVTLGCPTVVIEIE